MKDYIISRGGAKNALIEQPKQATIAISSSGIIEKVCPHTEKFFGFPPDEMVGQPFNMLVPAQVYDPNSPHYRETLKQGQSIQTTFSHKTGYFFTGSMALKSPDEENETSSLMTSAISKLDADGSTHSLMQDFQSKGKIGAWEYNIITDHFSWTDGVYRIFDLDTDSTITPEHALYYFHDYQHRIKALFRRCTEDGDSFSLEAPLISARNKKRWIRLIGKGQKTEGKVQRLFGTIQDISEIYDAQKNQSVFEDYVSSIIDSSDDLIIAVDKNLNVILFNEAYEKQFENTFESDIQVGDHVIDKLNNFPNEKRIYQRLWERALTRDSFCVEMPLAQRDDEMPVYEMRFSRVLDKQGEPIGAAHCARNISSKIKVQEKLNYMARHDPLTGLYNRREFQHLLGRAIGNAKKRGTKHAFLYMDLENFNSVNEGCGQTAGDELLRQVSHILTNTVRQRDDIARIGGDEFAALLENCGDQEAVKVAENIRNAIADLKFGWEDKSYQIGISIGIVTLNEQSDSPDKLMKLADSVCYAAKTSGSNKVNVYRPSTDQDDEDSHVNSLQIIKTIKHALDFEQYLRVYAQTIKPITSAVWGNFFEVLIRIEDEKGDSVYPSEFLPVAERYDLTREIDLRIVSRVLSWLTSHHHLEHRIKLCSVNLATTSIQNPRFTDKLLTMLEKTKADISKLCFELEEVLFIQHLTDIRDFVSKLLDMGCKVAIDGAGKIPSHYHYLKEFDIHYVKIAGDIVKLIDKDPLYRLNVETIHKIASFCGQQTIALHVENEGIMTEIRKMGLHFGQGFHIAKVVPLDQITDH